MKKIYRIFLCALGILLLAAIIFWMSMASNASNAQSVEINSVKNSYGVNENIILSGLSKKNSEIFVYINHQVGEARSDANGKWTVNLGNMPEGKYALGILSDDSSTSESVATAQISVSSSQDNNAAWEKIVDGMVAALSGRPITPEKLIMVPIRVPQVLQGKWQLMK